MISMTISTEARMNMAITTMPRMYVLRISHHLPLAFTTRRVLARIWVVILAVLAGVAVLAVFVVDRHQNS
jgi:hypothetical protein